MPDFKQSIKYGKKGEHIFIEEYLNFFNIKCQDVSSDNKYQKDDIDFVTPIGTFEIKLNYQDDGYIIIEEYTNINTSLGKESKGWFYKSKADKIVFISNISRSMIFLNFNDVFKTHYLSIKDNYRLKNNKISSNGDNYWQSAYRFIPVKSIKQFCSVYKKNVIDISLNEIV